MERERSNLHQPRCRLIRAIGLEQPLGCVEVLLNRPRREVVRIDDVEVGRCPLAKSDGHEPPEAKLPFTQPPRPPLDRGIDRRVLPIEGKATVRLDAVHAAPVHAADLERETLELVDVTPERSGQV